MVYASTLVLGVFVLLVGLWGRVHNFGSPQKVVWDEIHFPEFARDYLRGVPFFDPRPPLGKFIVAASIAISVRALLPLGAFLGRYLFRERVGAVLLAAILAVRRTLLRGAVAVPPSPVDSRPASLYKPSGKRVTCPV